MFRFVFLGVSFFVWIHQSQSSGGIEPTVDLQSDVSAKVFTPPSVTTTASTASASTTTPTTTTTAPSSTPYYDATVKVLRQCFTYKLNSLHEAIAKEQDALGEKVLKVIKVFENQRRALVLGIRNFPFSTVQSSTDRRTISRHVERTITCIRRAENSMDFPPIGITGDFNFPSGGETFEEELLISSVEEASGYVFGAIEEFGSESCLKKYNLGYAKLVSKYRGPFQPILKCAPIFTTVNVDNFKLFTVYAESAFKKIDKLVKTINSCKWSISNDIYNCSQAIVRDANYNSICEDTVKLGPSLTTMLAASYAGVKSCVESSPDVFIAPTEELVGELATVCVGGVGLYKSSGQNRTKFKLFETNTPQLWPMSEVNEDNTEQPDL